MKTALVTTTIHLPKNLEGYLDNKAKCGHDDLDVEVIVVGDKKSPAETADYLAELAERFGTSIEWWDEVRQRRWLKDLPELDRLLPWNSVQRRNLAYLQAAIRGADCIITVDDDNFATDDDFFGGHAIIGQRESLPSVSSSRGWFNTSSLLRTEPEKPLYHRGYPTRIRTQPETVTHGTAAGRVVVNAGLWLGVPDADAMCHLDAPVDAVGFRAGFEGRAAIAKGDDMVFNSQNTAFHRDTLPAMFLPPMGDRIGPLVVGRYDDIWMGIFFKRIADHLGDLVTAGRPLVRQDRNDHDLLQDALVEIPAQRITNTLTDTLQRVRLTADGWGPCYLELIEQLRGEIARDAFTGEERGYLLEMLRRMTVWAQICDELPKS